MLVLPDVADGCSQSATLFRTSTVLFLFVVTTHPDVPGAVRQEVFVDGQPYSLRVFVATMLRCRDDVIMTHIPLGVS